MSSSARSQQRRRRERVGKIAEGLAAAYLVAHGYRILERRFKTHVGEIDVIAVRRQRVAFVEVKFRQSTEDCEAAITGQLRTRVRRAAEAWLAKHAKYQAYDVGFDLIFMTPWKKPHHIENGL